MKNKLTLYFIIIFLIVVLILGLQSISITDTITEQWKVYDTTMGERSLTFIGNQSADNPWNKTVGLIDDGNLLMLPNTSTELEITSHQIGTLYFFAEISELVQVHSDGVILNINIQDAENNTLEKYQYHIASNSKGKVINIDLSQFNATEMSVILTCQGGATENCDWLILKDLAIYANYEIEFSQVSSSEKDSIFYNILSSFNQTTDLVNGRTYALLQENEQHTFNTFLPLCSHLHLSLGIPPFTSNVQGLLSITITEKESNLVLYEKLVNVHEKTIVDVNLNDFYNKDISIKLKNESTFEIILRNANIVISEKNTLLYFIPFIIAFFSVTAFIVLYIICIKKGLFAKQNRRQNILRIITILLFILICVLNRHHMYDTTVSKTETYKQPNYKFTPFINSDSKMVQEIIFTRPYIETIQIRMVNEHPDKINSIIEFSLWHEECIFSQKISSKDIVNWQYVTLNINQAVSPGQKYHLIIKEYENTSDIAYKIFLGQEHVCENTNLYLDDSVLGGELDIIYTYRYFSLKWLFLLLTIMGLILFPFRFNSEKWPKLYFILEPILFSIIILFIYEGLSFNTLPMLETNALILNISFIYALTLLGSALSKNTFWMYSIITVLFGSLGVINHFVLQFRGTVLLPLDIFSITTAAEVASSYDISMDRDILNFVFIIIVMLGLLFKIDRVPKKKCWPMFVSGNLIMLSCLLCMLIPNINNKLGFAIQQDAQTARSKEIGQLVNFVENIPYCIVRKPTGYSADTFEAIYEKYETLSSSHNVQIPNIICVMNESWADFSDYDSINISANYMESIYNLDEGNAIYGNCIVPVFGGGTSNSEFEFLTGYSKLFLGMGSAPYQQYVNQNTQSVASHLRENGYQTVAIHAANPVSWNRHIAYPQIGFDSFLSNRNSFENAEYCRYWISDRAFFNKIIEVYENKEKEKLFVFGITIQAHGGYDYESYENKISVSGDGMEFKDAEQYMTLVQDSNKAFADMISYFAKQEEPIIVVMFGDHLPSLSEDFYQQLYGTSEENYTIYQTTQKYTTPYVIWSNYDLAECEIPETISVNMLMPYVLKAAGIELTNFYEFLYNISKEIPVISQNIVWKNDKEPVNATNYLDDKNILSQYEILQYGLLFDNVAVSGK